ncbi:MAG: ribonuclease domain-containing protein [Christensenellaceae bacterium]|jgi:ribonuclease T1
MRRFTRLTGALLALLLVFSVLSGCGGAAPDVPSCTAAPAADAVPAADAPSDAEADAVSPGESDKSSPAALDEGGEYTSAEDVALYLHLYAHLPQNFITKKDARALGWNGGGLDDYADGKCIGGDRFGNYEGLLPDAPGREYHECDIDTLHAASRGAKRIVYSNDGLIYYTEDHYESFILLYGEE